MIFKVQLRANWYIQIVEDCKHRYHFIDTCFYTKTKQIQSCTKRAAYCGSLYTKYTLIQYSTLKAKHKGLPCLLLYNRNSSYG